MDLRMADKDAFEADAKAKVFISYSRADMAFVDRIEPALVARGFAVMIDRQEIYAFEDGGAPAILNQPGRHGGVSLSPDWLSSQVCKREIDYAAHLTSVWHRSSAAPSIPPRYPWHCPVSTSSSSTTRHGTRRA